MHELSITSIAFKDGESIPAKYTSDGDNVSPPIEISGVGEEAKSLALIMDDPDAAIDPDGPGKTFDHWVIFNISPETMEIGENTVPTGAIQGLNGMNESKYIGPAPPNGTHRYFFRLFELSDTLDKLDSKASKEDVLESIKNITLRQTMLMATYRKQETE